MSKRRSSRRTRVRLVSYTAAALLALGLFSAVSWGHLTAYRRQTRVDADRAFAETVDAVEDLGRSLEKSLYATDGPMAARICAEIYADAGRAGTALSALPFSTVEMEKLKSFLNRAGDYAYTLCREAAEQGFDEEQRLTMAELSEKASALADSLRGLRSDLADAALRMDTREAPVANILPEQPELLSGALGCCEAEFPALRPLRYAGQYSEREPPEVEPVDETQARRQAAALLECEPEELELAGQSEDGGRLLLCLDSRCVSVTAAGVETLRDTRLISESALSEAQAAAAAEETLEKLGYQNLKKEESERRGGALYLSYSAEQGGAAGLDRMIRVGVALDNGSLCALDLSAAAGEAGPDEWPYAALRADDLVPAGLTLQHVRPVTVAGADGGSIACYELSCLSGDDRCVRLYLNAETGRQERIELD